MKTTITLLACTCVVSSSSAQTCSNSFAAATYNGAMHATGITGGAILTPDARFVVFSTDANNIVPADSNGVVDVFVRDRTLGTVERDSMSTFGFQGNLGSLACDISHDGRFVAMVSRATNFDFADTNNVYDVYLRDRQAGTTTRISVPLGGGAANGESTNASISGNGRYVAFRSVASNLVPGDGNGSPDVFLLDRQTSQITLISVGFNGSGGGHVSFDQPQVSGDGRFVGFTSDAMDLLATPFVALWERVYVRDLQTSTTLLASFGPGGADVKTSCTLQDMSADGRFLAFDGGVATTVQHVHVWDRVTNVREAQDVTPGGTLGNAAGASPFLSPDGRWIAFASAASDLVAGDTNGYTDVFLRDRSQGTTSLVSFGWNGAQLTGGSSPSSIDATGHTVAFVTYATNVVSSGASGLDTYLRDCDLGAPTSYCVGQQNSQGCTPAIGFTGSPSASAGSGFLLTSSSTLNNKSGQLFYGVNGASMVPFLDGWLCMRGPVHRTPLQNSGGNPPPDDCSGSFAFDFNAHIASGVDPNLNVGTEVCCQYWSRDGGTDSMTHLSDAALFVIQP